ncbi:lysostaphin resistance A-like protein [Brachybacterium sp. AOP43-C2-M15]|uniref:lysostaphin resistance A-like protein n=1 Tax=Brachybacterium sp. AOP43-C2-M15 TaxID=3457661 RepID=UPI004034AB39
MSRTDASPSGSPFSSTPVLSSTPDLRRVLAFLGIALAVTTALSLPVATGLIPEAALGLVVPLAQLSPLLAALVVRRRGEPLRRSLGLAIPSWRVLAIASLAAIAAFVTVPLARVLVGIGAGAPPAAEALSVQALLLAVPAVLVMQGLFAIGEEAGWRGWLHRELSPLGFWPAALLIGVAWALWHAPIVLALGLSPREAVTYLGTIVAVAPLLSALRQISGTAWAAVLGHALFNSARVAIEQNVLGPVDPGTAWLLDLTSWALWIAVAWMVLRIGGSLAPRGGTPPGGRPARPTEATAPGAVSPVSGAVTLVPGTVSPASGAVPPASGTASAGA